MASSRTLSKNAWLEELPSPFAAEPSTPNPARRTPTFPVRNESLASTVYVTFRSCMEPLLMPVPPANGVASSPEFATVLLSRVPAASVPLVAPSMIAKND